MEGELAEARSVYAMGIGVEEYDYGCYNILLVDTLGMEAAGTGIVVGMDAGTGTGVDVVPEGLELM